MRFIFSKQMNLLAEEVLVVAEENSFNVRSVISDYLPSNLAAFLELYAKFSAEENKRKILLNNRAIYISKALLILSRIFETSSYLEEVSFCRYSAVIN